MLKGYTYEKNADGIVTVTIDMPGHPVNLMNAEFANILEEFTDRIVAEDGLKGVILTSGKSTFFAGGDLEYILSVKKEDKPAFYDRLSAIKKHIRRFETLGKPVVAAINGSAVGGGWEIALGCHGRIALDNPNTELGLPEVTLGLLPGAGGVVRTTRMMGFERALPYLIEGKRIGVRKGLEEGWLDAVEPTTEAMMEKARQFIEDNPAPVKPWDEKGFTIPGGGPNHPKIAQMLMVGPSKVRQKTRGLLPAPEFILATMVEGAQVDFDTASRIEARKLTELVVTPQAKNLISTFFFGLNALNAGASRPRDYERTEFNKVGILGAGMMGAGIAYACARAGISVVLKDVSLKAAEKGKSYSAGLLDKAITRGRSTEQKKQVLLDLIHPTAEVSELADCELVIEAVFEDDRLKEQVIRETEAVLPEDVIFASNTSSLPITMLAKSSRDAGKFIGLHFFSPVDRMQLVEIITGAETADETLAAAFDFALQIYKTPIVVNDSLGFFTSRVFGSFLDEGVQLMKDGVPALMVDNLGKQTGMPVGPLTVMDEVSLQLVSHVRVTNQRLLDEGIVTRPGVDAPALDEFIPQMLGQGRAGRSAGGGFYDYPEDAPRVLWPGLSKLFIAADPGLPYRDIKDRILFRQVIESLKCLEENIIHSVNDADIGSILGIGFPQHTGGVFQYINTYDVHKFVDRCNELAEKYGERFTPPANLVEKANSGALFA